MQKEVLIKDTPQHLWALFGLIGQSRISFGCCGHHSLHLTTVLLIGLFSSETGEGYLELTEVALGNMIHHLSV